MSNFKPNYFQRRSKPQGPKANERIRALDVQVIGSDGGNLGAMPLNKAIELAKQAHKQAIESNDADSIARATEALSTAIAEKKYIEASEARSRMDNIQTAPAEESPISETQPEVDE